MSDSSGRPRFSKRRDDDGIYIVVEPSGKQYGPYNHTYSEALDASGTPYFAARRGEHRYAVHGDTEYGPYQTVYVPKIIGGKLCFLAMNLKGDETLYYLVHGERTYGPFGNVDWGSLSDQNGSPTIIFYEGDKMYRFEAVVTPVFPIGW